MSTWNLGIDDVSPQAQAFKDKLASKDSHIAALQSQLLKQAADLDELKAALNDALHKLSHESNRALRLESDLTQASEDLRNEKVASQNAKSALDAAHEKIKSKDSEARDMQVILESLSQTSDSHHARSSKLEREKATLDTRVRELESELRQLSRSPPTPAKHTAARPRSSSPSNARITTLEQQLHDVRESLSQKDIQLRATNQKLTSIHDELIKTGNEKVAMEKRVASQLNGLRASLEEKEEEIIYLRTLQGDSSREEQLLRRIEEDEAKIEALEMMLGDGDNMQSLKDSLRRAEAQLRVEIQKVAVGESMNVELVREREEALDELDSIRTKMDKLSNVLDDRDRRIESLIAEQQKIKAEILSNDVDLLGPVSEDAIPFPTPPTAVPQDQVVVAYIERLLTAIERLRGERDNLRRDIQFIESEAKFAIDALENKLAAVPSSNIPTRILRDQIEELEMRVMRRTEQIGLHQHDIRRLETNLRLQEERLNELTSELETVAIQKDTMVEDCADAREARDEAIARVEELEVEMECLQRKLELRSDDDLKSTNQAIARAEELEDELEDLARRLEDEKATATKARDEAFALTETLKVEIENLERQLEQGDTALVALVGVMIQNIGQSRDAIRRSKEAAHAHIPSIHSQVEYQQMQYLLKENASTSDRLYLHSQRLHNDILQVTMALAVSQSELNKNVYSMRMLKKEKEELNRTTKIMQRQLEDEQSMVASLTQRLEADQAETVGSVSVMASQISELESQIQSIQEAMDAMEAKHHAEVDKLVLSKGQLQQDLTEQHRILEENLNQLRDERAAVTSLTQQLEDVRADASTSTSVYAARISELETQITDYQQTISSVEATHQVVMTDIIHSKEQLQMKLDEANRMLESNDLEGELVQLKMQHIEALGELQSQLVETSSALEEYEALHASVKAQYEQAQEDATKSRQELEQHVSAAKDSALQINQLEGQMEKARQDHIEKVTTLQNSLDAALQDIKECRRSRDELALIQDEQANQIAHITSQSLAIQKQLENELDDLKVKVKEQAHELENSAQKVLHLVEKLEEEVDGHELGQAELKSANERLDHAEFKLKSLSEELITAREQLEVSTSDFESLREENISLQEEITTLEGERQRSISLCRFLESQAKDSERTIASLTTELERNKIDLLSAEKLSKAAEVNLSLQVAQHKREMSDIQRELTALRSAPDLKNTVTELEERIAEMEELLRTKCIEIEENDDRVLEMLKDNKKLNTKVESLTRKVQSLQTKLAATKVSVTKPLPTIETRDPSPSSSTNRLSAPATAPRSRSNTLSSTTPLLENLNQPSMAPISRTISNRTVSGTSSVPRPKTPERRAVPPPVFKARTPEKRTPSVIDPVSLPSTSSIGKKRRAPDDFEACESVPPQGFTVDSLPDEIIHTTPRVRRVLSSIQSGFTPVRHMRPMPSPKRAVTSIASSPFMASDPDLSSAKPSKRSWLGKIRGVSTTSTTGRPASSRPVYGAGIGESS